MRVEHHIRACESTAFAPCQDPMMPEVAGVKIYCKNGFIVVERTVVNRISTPLPLGKCHVLITVVSEFIYTQQPCTANDPLPPEGTWELLWQAAVQEKSTPLTEPAPEYPKITFEPSEQGVCYPDINIRFETDCVCEGVFCKIVITRVVTWTAKYPVSPTHCHVMKYVTRQPHKTNIDCIPGEKLSDWLSEDQIKSIWENEYAGSPDIPFHDPVVNPGDTWIAGRELNVPRFLKSAVDSIRQQEKDAGIIPDGQQRNVHIVKINDSIPNLETLAAIEPGRPIRLEIGIEGSDFRDVLVYRKQSTAVKKKDEIQ